MIPIDFSIFWQKNCNFSTKKNIPPDFIFSNFCFFFENQILQKKKKKEKMAKKKSGKKIWGPDNILRAICTTYSPQRGLYVVHIALSGGYMPGYNPHMRINMNLKGLLHILVWVISQKKKIYIIYYIPCIYHSVILVYNCADNSLMGLKFRKLLKTRPHETQNPSM